MKYSFILVEPKVPENIGASARALKTMGYSSLILVNPCPDPKGSSKWLAHGSHDILDKAIIHDSLKEAVKDFDLVIATTTRKRKVQNEIVAVGDLAGFIENKGNTVNKVALVFGNEESGLSNSDLSLCDVSSAIPLAVDFPSLNLSQAVMLYAYELSSEIGYLKHSPEIEISGEDSLKIINKRIIELLTETSIPNNPALYGRIFERLAHVSGKDLKLIHTITGQILDIINNRK